MATKPLVKIGVDLAATQFSVNTADSFPFTVAPGGSATFDLTFAPTEVGMHVADISIPNPNPAEDPYTFTVTGGEVFVAQKKGSGLGTVMAGEIACGPDCNEMIFPSTTNNTAVLLKAVPEPGYRFVRWEAPDGTLLSSPVRAEAGSTAIAIFEEE